MVIAVTSLIANENGTKTLMSFTVLVINHRVMRDAQPSPKVVRLAGSSSVHLDIEAPNSIAIRVSWLKDTARPDADYYSICSNRDMSHSIRCDACTEGRSLVSDDQP